MGNENQEEKQEIKNDQIQSPGSGRFLSIAFLPDFHFP